MPTNPWKGKQVEFTPRKFPSQSQTSSTSRRWCKTSLLFLCSLHWYLLSHFASSFIFYPWPPAPPGPLAPSSHNPLWLRLKRLISVLPILIGSCRSLRHFYDKRSPFSSPSRVENGKEQRECRAQGNLSCHTTKRGNTKRTRFEIHDANFHWMHCSFGSTGLACHRQEGGFVGQRVTFSWQMMSIVVTGAMLLSLGFSTYNVAWVLPVFLQLCLKVNFLFKIKFCFLIQAVVIFSAKRLCLGFLDQVLTLPLFFINVSFGVNPLFSGFKFPWGRRSITVTCQRLLVPSLTVDRRRSNDLIGRFGRRNWTCSAQCLPPFFSLATHVFFCSSKP